MFIKWCACTLKKKKKKIYIYIYMCVYVCMYIYNIYICVCVRVFNLPPLLHTHTLHSHTNVFCTCSSFGLFLQCENKYQSYYLVLFVFIESVCFFHLMCVCVCVCVAPSIITVTLVCHLSILLGIHGVQPIILGKSALSLTFAVFCHLCSDCNQVA